MKLKFITIVAICFSRITGLDAQYVKSESSRFEAVKVSVSYPRLGGRETIRVIKDSTVTETDAPTFARLKDLQLRDGTIEVDVLSRMLPNAPEHARGFIGVAFRIDSANTRFESIYLRPANAMADEQLRRNRAIQYFSYPDYKFDRLRKDAAGQYESYAPIALNEWIKMKIVIEGSQARLYLNNAKEPSLVVKDLKLGENITGSIGLWVSVGTEGFFSNLKVKK